MSVDLQHNLEERMRRELPHLTVENRCVLVCIIERLVEVYQPDRIYLFGSKARGGSGPDSDYDLLVLVEHPTEPLYRLSQRGFRALRGIAAAVDVVVWDRAALRMQRNHAMSAVSQRDLEDQMRCGLPHLTDGDVRALACIIERLAEAYEPDRIYLFGSKARGDYGPDSDFDLMVVVPDDAPPARKRSRLAYEALRGTGTAADVQVWTCNAFESRLHLLASLPATVMSEGRLLHAA